MLRFGILSLMAFAVACGGEDKAATDGCGSGCGDTPPAKVNTPPAKVDVPKIADKTPKAADKPSDNALKTVQLDITGMS